MKEIKMKLFTCPCCRSKVKPKQMTKMRQYLPFQGMVRVAGAKELDALIEGLIPDWACDDCLTTKQAIGGNPKKQFYTFKNPWDAALPFLAYWDRSFTCQNCQEKFDFPKEEQRHWYEELGFVVFSKPKDCPSCRKVKKEWRNTNTQLSNLLKKGTPNTKKSLLEIAELYTEMGKEERAKFYRKKAAVAKN